MGGIAKIAVCSFLMQRYAMPIAVIAAASIHALVMLNLHMPHSVHVESLNKPLSVSIYSEPTIEPKPKHEQSKPKENQQTEGLPPKQEPLDKPQPLQGLSDDIMAVDKTQNDASSKKPIQVSTNSKRFKRFLESENNNFVTNNPESVTDFDQTFEPAPNYRSPEELSSSNPKARFKGGNDFMTENKGRRRCFVRTMNLADVTVPDAYVSKDCTPEKTFDLKLNKPSNGWSSR